MHHPARFLVDDEQVVVLVDHRHRQGLGPVGAAFLGGQQGHRDPLAGAHALRRAARRLAVDADLATLDQPLQVAARELRRQADDHLVEPLAVQRLGDFAFARFRRVVLGIDDGLEPIRFVFHLAPFRR